MKKFSKTLCALVLPPLLFPAVSGCSKTPLGGHDDGQGQPGVEIEQMDAVTSGGNRQAVLSLHKKYAYRDACKYGLTLTNNLPYKITNLSFRFTALIQDDVPYRPVTRNFFEIDPTNAQYRTITFSGIDCAKIHTIEVTDPGRCAMGELNRFTSRSGDCIRHVHIAPTPYVKLVRK